MTKKTTKKSATKKLVPWTLQEEERMLANIESSITNLSKAFEKTSKEINRTPSAVAGHWYSHVSRDTNHVLFLTVSGKHVAINRKNGKGNPSKLSVFQRILAILGM